MVRLAVLDRRKKVSSPVRRRTSGRLQTAHWVVFTAARLFLADHVVGAADVFANFHQRFSHLFQNLGHFILLFKFRLGQAPVFLYTNIIQILCMVVN